MDFGLHLLNKLQRSVILIDASTMYIQQTVDVIVPEGSWTPIMEGYAYYTDISVPGVSSLSGANAFVYQTSQTVFSGPATGVGTIATFLTRIYAEIQPGDAVRITIRSFYTNTFATITNILKSKKKLVIYTLP